MCSFSWEEKCAGFVSETLEKVKQFWRQRFLGVFHWQWGVFESISWMGVWILTLNLRSGEPYQNGGDDERAVGQRVRDVGGPVLVAVRHVKATVGVPDPNLHRGERVRGCPHPHNP